MTPPRTKPVKKATRKPAAPETAEVTRVSRIMSRDVVTVRAGTSLESVVELMLNQGLSRVPVVDEEFRPVGIVSKTDVVEEEHDREDLQEVPLKGETQRGFHVHREGAVVDDVMTKTVLTLDESDTVERAAEVMVSKHVHGLPVVDSNRELAGFVSTMDVLAWLAGLR